MAKARVIVVSTRPEVRARLLSVMGRYRALEVCAADGLVEAARRLDDRALSAVVLDLEVLGEEAAQVAGWIRRHHPLAQIIAVAPPEADALLGSDAFDVGLVVPRVDAAAASP